VKRRHVMEMKYLVPSALAFNAAAFLLAYFDRPLFADHFSYAALGTLQLLISLAALVDCVRNFKRRGTLLPMLFR